MKIGTITTAPMHMMEIMNIKNPFMIKIKESRRDWIGIIITSCITIGKLIASWTDAVKLLFKTVWNFLIIGSCGCNCEFKNMFTLLICPCDILTKWSTKDSLKFFIIHKLSDIPSVINDMTFSAICFSFSISSLLWYPRYICLQFNFAYSLRTLCSMKKLYRVLPTIKKEERKNERKRINLKLPAW